MKQQQMGGSFGQLPITLFGGEQQNGVPLQGQRFRGAIKSYSESNGYGFIGGDEVMAGFGKDVFIHQREVTEVTGIARPQIPSGIVVTFSVTISPKGQPQARELRFEDQSFLQMQQMSQSMGVSMAGGGQTHGGLTYVQNGRRFKGYVRSFSQNSGFGFVGGDDITPQFGKDVFLHYRELQQLYGPSDQKPTIPVGTWITFTVTMNQKGQPQARDVQFEQPTTGGGQYDAASNTQQPQTTNPAAMGASAAVAALNLQNQPGSEGNVVGMGAFAPQQQQQHFQQQGFSNAQENLYSHSHMHEDIARFQRQVEEQRAAGGDPAGGAQWQDDASRSRGMEQGTAAGDTREHRSRSPRRE